MGKSSLAAKFALLWKHMYSDGVLYFNAESEETLIDSIKQNVINLTDIIDSFYAYIGMSFFAAYSFASCCR